LRTTGCKLRCDGENRAGQKYLFGKFRISATLTPGESATALLAFFHFWLAFPAHSGFPSAENTQLARIAFLRHASPGVLMAKSARSSAQYFLGQVAAHRYFQVLDFCDIDTSWTVPSLSAGRRSQTSRQPPTHSYDRITTRNNHKKPNAERVWKQLEDFLVPRLALCTIDRAVYSHLLRHSRLEGKLRLSFSIAWLARGARISNQPTRLAVRRLISQGALHLVERSKSGHVVEVRLPEEVPGVSNASGPARGLAHHGSALLRALDIEDTDFLQTKSLRESIHSRERSLCFYCLRKLNERVQCLDHVVPQVRLGRNSYRNLVSACLECNSHKGETPAPDFLRWLYRERRITATELTARLRALDALAAGRLRPILATSGNPPPRRGRPPLHA
jgi:hypothetical protein